MVDGRIAEYFAALDTHAEDVHQLSTSTWKPKTNSEYSSWQLKTIHMVHEIYAGQAFPHIK